MTIGALLILAANLIGSTWLLAASWTLDILVRRQAIQPVPNLRIRIAGGVAGILSGIAVGVCQVLA